MDDRTVSLDLFQPKPLLVVISGPSGVGKDSVIKALKRKELPFQFVVTATSRAPRKEEKHGRDYIFVTRQQFDQMIEQDVLIEHAIVYGQQKGIPKSQVEEALNSGKDVIVRVDVQGAEKVRSLYPGSILIFIIPANIDEWHNRLTERKGDTEEAIRLRLEIGQRELERVDEYDYLVVNPQDRLDDAADTIEAIINAEHHRVHHREIHI